MLRRKTPARKFKRRVKRVILLGTVICGLVLLLGGTGYYLVAVKFKKPLYVSPLSGYNTAPGSAGHQAPGFAGKQSVIVPTHKEDDPLNLLKEELKHKNIAFTDVKVASNSSLMVSLKEGGIVNFSSQKDILTQISSLQFILSRLTMEGKLFSQLDLRFEKPVIVMK
jgi:hypothetical protein